MKGMSESVYHTAVKLNRKWTESKIGEIRTVTAFKFHGKIYCFYKEEIPFFAIVSSANLVAIKLEAVNRRQYETAALTTGKKETAEISSLIAKLNSPICSDNIANTKKMPLIRETNRSLDGIEFVSKVSPSNIEFYKQRDCGVSFFLKLKVPRFCERHMDDGNHYTNVLFEEIEKKTRCSYNDIRNRCQSRKTLSRLGALYNNDKEAKGASFAEQLLRHEWNKKYT